MKPKPHGMTGKTNAAKDVTSNAHIHLRLPMADKNKFTRHAQNLGITLSVWLLGVAQKSIDDK